MKEVRWEYLKGRAAAARLRRKPVVYLPVGCLERHGCHLPMGLDVLKAHAVCCECARKTGGVVFPAHFYAGLQFGIDSGDDAKTRRIKRKNQQQRAREWHNLYTNETAEETLVEILRQIREMGVRVVVLYSGHYAREQVDMIPRVAQRFNRARNASMQVIPFLESTFFGVGDHAGIWETSIYMALCPEHVDMSKIGPANYKDHGWHDRNDPRRATPAFGRKAIRQICAHFKAEIARLLDQSR